MSLSLTMQHAHDRYFVVTFNSSHIDYSDIQYVTVVYMKAVAVTLTMCHMSESKIRK